MTDPTDITLPITPAKIQRAIGHIVEQVHPRPRGDNCIPIAEMERKLTAYVGDAVQAAYNDAAGIAKDARDRLARHLFLKNVDTGWEDHFALLWDRQSEQIDRDAVYADADELLNVITGKGQP